MKQAILHDAIWFQSTLAYERATIEPFESESRRLWFQSTLACERATYDNYDAGDNTVSIHARV